MTCRLSLRHFNTTFKLVNQFALPCKFCDGAISELQPCFKASKANELIDVQPSGCKLPKPLEYNWCFLH